jgi:transposase
MSRNTRTLPKASDIFAPGARPGLLAAIGQLPENTRFAVTEELAQVDGLQERIKRFEARMEQECAATREAELLDSLPGVGLILHTVGGDVAGDQTPRNAVAPSERL